MSKDLKKLVDEIDEYDEAYYNDSISLISDPEYDYKKDQLSALNDSFVPNTKTEKKLKERIDEVLKRIDAPPNNSPWEKVVHEIDVTSLNKVNFPEELIEWAQKCGNHKTYLITEKLDGLTISLKYENGKLIQGATRGSRGVGEDITRNILKIKDVPHTLTKNFTGYIRGEILLLHSDLKKHFPDLANARNAASGIVKRFDGTGSEHLTVKAYTIEGSEDFKTEAEAFDYIADLSFNIPSYYIGTIEDANNIWKKYMDSIRDTLDHDIDGLVVRINDRAEQFALGEEGKGPKGAIAYKFEAPQARSFVTDIFCQVGDTGVITPVPEFESVYLLGSNITRASLYNFKAVKDLNLNIGAEIIVIRANDVIPKILKVVTPNNGYFQPPTKCPECGADTKFIGEYLYCTNKQTCPAQKIGRLNKWISELNIMEWGESILTKLIEAGKVNDVADLYLLKAEDISSLDRMGEKSAQNLIEELDKYRQVTLENLIGGLSINGVATSTVRSVIDAGYNSLDKIKKASVEDLIKISGFGDKKAKALRYGLIDNLPQINNILAAGVTIKQRATGCLTGKSFCITGSTEKPRGVLQKMIEESGGKIKKSVKKGVDWLVIADPNSTSSKAVAARKMGLSLLSEKQLLEMIKNV